MMMSIKVSCEANDRIAGQLRHLLCVESRSVRQENYNPLVSTGFNTLLNELAQAAFEEGRDYQRNLKEDTE